MSQLYRHLLIPPDAEFLPATENIATFFATLDAAGAMPAQSRFVVVRPTDRVTVGRNPETGEAIPISRLQIDKFSTIEPALSLIESSTNFDLLAWGYGPTKVPPSNVYSADNYATSVLGDAESGKYEYEIHCHFRDQVEQVHWSAFGRGSDKDRESGLAIHSPWAEKPIFPSGSSHSRFTVEFGIGDYHMPRITDTVEILNPRLVAIANQSFGVTFTQGCRINED